VRSKSGIHGIDGIVWIAHLPGSACTIFASTVAIISCEDQAGDVEREGSDHNHQTNHAGKFDCCNPFTALLLCI
jgi:hypothetical protein